MAEKHHSVRFPPPPPSIRGLAATFLLCALVICFYWQLTFTSEFTWLHPDDIARQVLPWLQFQASEWKQGRVALWDPTVGMGQPLLAQMQPGTAYPLNWLLFSLPLTAGGWLHPLALTWYFIVIHLIGAACAYLLARQLGCGRPSAVFGGVAFSVLGWMAENLWPQMLNGAVWAPIVFLFVFRAMRGRAVWVSAVLGGMALGFSWLGGHHQVPLFVCVASAAYWLWGARRDWRLLLAAALFFAVALGVGALQILPAAEYARLSVRWTGAQEPLGWGDKVPWSVHRQYSMDSWGMLGIILPTAHSVVSGFLGITTLTLALLGLVSAGRRREVRWLGVLGLFSLLYAMAPYSPLEGLVYSLLPSLDKARTPAMALMLFALAATMLAAVGLEKLTGECRRRPSLKWAVRILLAFGGLVFAVRAVDVTRGEQHLTSLDRLLVPALSALLLAALFRFARRRSALFLGCLGLLLVDASSDSTYRFPSLKSEPARVASLKALSEHADIAAFLRGRPGAPRTDIDTRLIGYNFGDWYGIPTAGGYVASELASVRALAPHSGVARRLLGVEYAVRKEPDGFYRELVFRSASGLNVYRAAGVLARAFSVHGVEMLPEQADLDGFLHANANRISAVAFLPAPLPALEHCAALDRVGLEEHRANFVRIQAEMSCRGLVVLSDAAYPGWEATIDGRPARILPAYGALRAVVVEAGAHRVEYRFKAQKVRLGALISTITALLGTFFASFCVLRSRFARRPEVRAKRRSL